MSGVSVVLIVSGVVGITVACVAMGFLQPYGPFLNESVEEGIESIVFSVESGSEAISSALGISSEGSGLSSRRLGKSLLFGGSSGVVLANEGGKTGVEFCTSGVGDFLGGSRSVAEGNDGLVSLGGELLLEGLGVVDIVEGGDPLGLLGVPVLNLGLEGSNNSVEGIESFLGGGREVSLSGGSTGSGSLGELSAEFSLLGGHHGDGFIKGSEKSTASAVSLADLGINVLGEPCSDSGDGLVEFGLEGLDGFVKLSALVLVAGSMAISVLVSELLLEVDDLLLEFLSPGSAGLLESSSLLAGSSELKILGLSVLGGEGVGELGKGFLSVGSAVSEGLFPGGNGGGKGLSVGIDFLLGPFGNSVDLGVELLELIAEVVMELRKELRVG